MIDAAYWKWRWSVWLQVDPDAKDICYRNLTSDSDWAKRARPYLLDMYRAVKDILDKKFISQSKDDLQSCFAELYFAAVCRMRLNLEITHPSDRGLDFFLNAYDCWVECITATDGKDGSPNSIPRSEIGEVRSFPEKQFLLRMSSSFAAKSKKAKEDMMKMDSFIKQDQPIVIFISAGALQDGCLAYPLPKLFDVLLGIGQIKLNIDKNTGAILEVYADHRSHLQKEGKEDIEAGYFLNSAHSHISAVIYSWADFSNPQEIIGQDFYTLHNPLAKNKLKHGFIPCGKEYVFADNALNLINTFDPDKF